MLIETQIDFYIIINYWDFGDSNPSAGIERFTKQDRADQAEDLGRHRLSRRWKIAKAMTLDVGDISRPLSEARRLDTKFKEFWAVAVNSAALFYDPNVSRV